MKKLTITICLTIAVLLGSIGASESADYQVGLTAYEKGDYATALREWTPLAEQGSGDAQYLLGMMYRGGQGVPKDYKSAVKWWTLAAKQGHALAQYNLGFMYRQGRGVSKNMVYAHMWWVIAASSGKSKNASKNRGLTATRMNSSQIEKAKKLARECVRKKYKGC